MINSWKTIFFAYHNDATKTKILTTTWEHSSNLDKFFIVICIIIFVISLYLYLMVSEWYMVVAVLCEVLFLLKINGLKEHLILTEYGGVDNSQAPPSSTSHQSTRYLMFKKNLNDKNITKSHIHECIPLVDLQVDILSTKDNPFKKLSTFIFGLLSGIAAALWKGLDAKSLMLISIPIIAIALIFSAVASIFPSKLEKLKEMKYFMLLYCREIP